MYGNIINNIRAFLVCLLFTLISAAIPLVSIKAQTPTIQETNSSSGRYRELEQKIKELENKLDETRNRGKTLSSEIIYMNSQIERTKLQISLTEKKISDLTDEIASLSGKINKLELSLTKVGDVLLSRIVATYKQGKPESIEIFFGSESFGDFLLRLKYMRAAQAKDKLLMQELQEAKTIFAEHKAVQEDKKKQQESLKTQLDRQKVQLDNQKAAKARLLAITKNDEKKYQELLASAKAEFEAIQAIIAGKGDETEAGKVNEGDKIASIIESASCNSSGKHLHFIVRTSDGNTKNPFVYLKPGVDYENCSGSSCGSSDGDQFNPSGNWNWPINPTIRYSQGYGSTWAVHNTWVGRVYSFHNGIDINGSSSDVKAVKSGILYQGSYTGINGCRLRYVRVKHDDSDIETLYLHINY